MIPINNTVLIKPDKQSDTIMLAGKPFYIDISWNKGRYQQQWATVIQVPEFLTMTKEYSPTSLPWQTPMELVVGDKICCQYLSIMYPVMKLDENIVIKYNDIYLAVRNEKIIMLNGFLLIEPLPEDNNCTLPNKYIKSGNLIIPDSSQRKFSNIKGKVAYCGSLISKYQQDIDPDTDEIDAGDTVIFRPCSDNDLENDMFRFLDKKYFIMHRHRILCKLYE